MTIRLVELADEVRILELEARKLELENRIACMKSEQLIDDDCIGCAGPCKVVDVAAKLQKELDTTHTMYLASADQCLTQSNTIDDLRAELFDFKNSLPSNFWAVVIEKDSMIRRQGKIIEDFKAIETRETDRLHKIIDELESRLSSARKGDSGVLMEVVSVLKTWNECHRTNRSALDQLSDIVKDYLDAPEEPPETPIDEDQDIGIVFTYGEIL